MNELIPHWLTKQASLLPNQIALECVEGQSLTFLQLKEKSEQLARKLANLQVEKGTRVAILAPNSIDMVIAIHALSYLEAIVVLLNIRLTTAELTYQLEQSKASLLLTTAQLKREKSLSFPEQRTFAQIKQQRETAVSLAEEINLQTPFTMMYTSGTTGKPKGVIHTYGNHWWSAISSVLNLGLEQTDKWLLTLPIFHVGGLSILIRSVIYGIPVFLMKKYDAVTLKKALYEHRVTIASLVTMMLKQLLDLMKSDEKLPEHVRCILLGGGSVPEPILKQAEAKGIPLFQSYGMTETSSQIVTLSATYARKKLGSAGKPLFSASIKIHQPDHNGIGEILVKGPMVFNGYDQLAAENERAFQSGWFHTGDLGYIDADGFLYVNDRRTDLIISGGENIYPSEIEDVLLQYDGVQEAAVVGKRDAHWGEIPVAFIVTHHVIEHEKLLEFAKDYLAPYKLPQKIITIDQLPRNASNKVMRYRLVERLEHKHKN